MCSPGKGDCRIPSRWKAVYPPRSEPSVASRRCWRADRVAKPNVCVYSHSLGNVKFAPSHSPEFAPRRSIRLPLDACHASSGTPGPLRFPNARALSLPGAPPTPTRVRRAVSIGRIEPGHSLVRFSDELWNWLFDQSIIDQPMRGNPDPTRSAIGLAGELVCSHLLGGGLELQSYPRKSLGAFLTTAVRGETRGAHNAPRVTPPRSRHEDPYRVLLRRAPPR